jgi:hypothetical protein
MGSLMRLVVSLVTIAALAGSPAAAAACTLLCAPGTGHTAGHATSGSASPAHHEGHVQVAPSPAPATHDHAGPEPHQAERDHVSRAPAEDAASSNPRVADGDCCVHGGDRVAAAIVAAVRSDVNLVLVAPGRPTSVQASRPPHGAGPRPRPSEVPAPTPGALRVLRI